ncbi:MAG: S8 family peptidase [Singulisphaera sp.]
MPVGSPRRSSRTTRWSASSGAGQRQGRGYRRPEAWSVTTGSPATIVAVLDTGIDLGHPELAGRVWTNPGEVAANGVDDDGNGYVDDIHGWNFAAGTNDVQDDNGHGSHVSGTIAASGNDGAGVVGVAWNATILPLKILVADGGGEVEAAIAAIDYAVQAGARVINASWTLDSLSRPLVDAIRAAGVHGVVFVDAAGNEGANNDRIPTNRARPSNQITVAAIDAAGRLAGFSNYGKRSVDLAAPGVGIWSTVPGGYDTYSGTSMAAPHVSGVVALLSGLHPEYTAEQLVARVLGTTKSLGSLTKKTRTGGMVDAAFALGVAGSGGTVGNRLHAGSRPVTGAVAPEGRGGVPRGPRRGLRQQAIPRRFPLEVRSLPTTPTRTGASHRTHA